jgi:hypothetical protein
MNQSTQGNRYYAEEFKDNASRWRNGLFVALCIVGMAAFFCFASFLIGSHVGARNANANWQMRFDADVSRAVTAAKANFVGPSPKWTCDGLERTEYLRACFQRGKSRVTKP